MYAASRFPSKTVRSSLRRSLGRWTFSAHIKVDFFAQLSPTQRRPRQRCSCHFFFLCLSVVCVLFAPIIVGWPRERWEGGWVGSGKGGVRMRSKTMMMMAVVVVMVAVVVVVVVYMVWLFTCSDWQAWRSCEGTCPFGRGSLLSTSWGQSCPGLEWSRRVGNPTRLPPGGQSRRVPARMWDSAKDDGRLAKMQQRGCNATEEKHWNLHWLSTVNKTKLMFWAPNSLTPQQQTISTTTTN